MALIKEFLAWLILLLFWFYLCQHRNYHIFARIEIIGKMCKRLITWSDFSDLSSALFETRADKTWPLDAAMKDVMSL